MDFEERVKSLKQRCKENQNNNAFRLTKDEMDTLILAFQAGDMSVGETLYLYLEHYMNTVMFNVGGSIISGASRNDFMMDCREVFFKCLEKYDYSKGERFEAYLSKAILNESFKFKKKLARESRETSIVFESGFVADKLAQKKGVDITKVSSLVNDREHERIEDAILKPEVLKLLDKLGADHKQVIIDHVLKGMTYAEIGAKEGKHKSTIKTRYYKAIKELRMFMNEGHKSVAVNTDGVNYRMIKSYRTWKAELAKREGKIDFETELLPYLSEEYKYVFLNVLQNYNGEPIDSISAKLHKNSRYVDGAITQIFNKMDGIIYQKQTIKEFYERYGGEEGKKDLESFLSENLKIVLNEYMLSINPDAARFVKEKYPDRFPQDMYKYVLQILNTFDNIMERKKNCESFIRRYGGYDFLVNVFGPTLSDSHYSVLVDTMMDYHYSTLVAYSASIGKSSNYANATQEKILDKLLALKKENAIPEVANSKISE